ncbi:MAG: Fur family transcriptional regulator [Candidatus Paceibacterota bacterium]|jgi:Fe2+ or Zn2+ uptake regulation protein
MKNDFNQLLKDAHLKVTEARLAVLSVFSSQCKPLSVEDISQKLKGKKIDLVTIYRTLASLEKVGIVNRVDLRRDAAYYELSDHHHHHIICTSCGKTEEFEECEIEGMLAKAVKKSKKFKSLSGHSFELFGLCTKCV